VQFWLAADPLNEGTVQERFVVAEEMDFVELLEVQQSLDRAVLLSRLSLKVERPENLLSLVSVETGRHRQQVGFSNPTHEYPASGHRKITPFVRAQTELYPRPPDVQGRRTRRRAQPIARSS
jgi:hypothetical protein